LPGQTTLSQAASRIQTFFALPDEAFPSNSRAVGIFLVLPLPDFHSRLYGMPLVIQLDDTTPERVINEIGWRFPDQSNADSRRLVTIGDVVTTLGAPSCVFISPMAHQGWLLIWDTPAGLTEALIQGGNRLYWTQPIESLNFRPHTLEDGRDACYSDFAYYYPWSGLISKAQYSLRYRG
jgi:hypothetical protein